jgi:hypothetical protein
MDRFRVPPSEERGNSHEENLVGKTIAGLILGVGMSIVEELEAVSNHS